MGRSVRRRLATGACALALLFAPGCTDDGTRPDLVAATVPPESSPEDRSIEQPVEEPAPARAFTAPDPAAFRSIVASATGPTVEVFDAPDGESVLELPNPTPSGGPLVFLVTETGDDWHEVVVPLAPPGSPGWVRDGDVELAAHSYRIEVDLEALVLRVFDRTATVLETGIGVGAEGEPPPGAGYYVVELLAAADPNPIYGTYAYGLSGGSETLETFTGEPGQYGIHGSADPDSIGARAGPGSIRMSNDAIAELVAFLPLGVPVSIR